jgi:Putative Flp pilus-assembly TadE/G-like
MIANRQSTVNRREGRGISIIIVAVAMIFILGVAGLGIDLASLYVGRSQAQRAADAAALAGAEALRDTPGCVPDSTGAISGNCVSIAQQQAKLVGDQNLIAGVSPGIIATSDVVVDTSIANDPRVTVYAGRGTYDGADHTNPMPTFFLKVFGIQTANVSAQATAEAFNPSGSGVPVGVTCVKPWFIANCDAYNTGNTQDATNCAQSTYGLTKGGQPGAFVTGNMSGGDLAVARPEAYPTGAYGEPITLKPGSPGSAAAPGQYSAAFIPNTTAMPAMCPSCAKSGGSGGPGVGSAAVYRADIECCNQNPLVCGPNTVTIQSSAGNMVGPTNQGVDCLIQQNPGCGQDHLDGVTGSPCTPINDPLTAGDIPNYPFKIMPGANDAYAQGASYIPSSASSSVVAVPIYEGVLQSGQNQVNIIGFMQMFIKYVDNSQQGTVYGYVMDITTCGGGGTGAGNGGSYISGNGGSAIPVRLIRPGSGS